jgi:hypothetical protein
VGVHIDVFLNGIGTQYVRVVPPAELACSKDSGQTGARNHPARANSGDASRGAHSDKE